MCREVIGLTGEVRYRIGLFGKVIIQVEETSHQYDPRGGGSLSPEHKSWRDARIADIQELGLTLTVNGDE